MNNNQKTFLIVNLSYLGDVLVTNSLCRNLKKEYPDSKIVFLVNKPLYEAAKYQEGVDDVIYIDKRNEQKGFWGLLKFAFSCKYRNQIDVAFIIYSNLRGLLVSCLLNSRKKVSGPVNFFNYFFADVSVKDEPDLLKMQDINGNFARTLTGKKAQVLPIKYNVSPENNFLAKSMLETCKNQDLIGLCCISKIKEKNMPLETALEIIKILELNNKTPVLFGSGNGAREFSDNLKKRGCLKFIDLTDVTSIYDLANIISICKGVISVDTGTMHLSYAVNSPVVCVFYKQINVEKWAPDTGLYNVYVEYNNFSAQNITGKLFELIGRNKQNISKANEADEVYI